MSSEEVAQLAQAIHSHADALVESWSRGPDAVHRMTRMEDTFELLADPELTPRLEHLVSTFVRRDKAKRQQGTSPFSPNNAAPAIDSPQNYVHHHHVVSPPQSPNSVVTQIPIQTVGLMGRNLAMPTPVATNPGGNSAPTHNGGPKKHLPKSILAAVQRFETVPSSPQSSPTSTLTLHNQYHSVSPAPEVPRIGTTIPGIGPISRNLVWGETNSRHSVTERSMGRTIQHPVVVEENNVNGLRSSKSPTVSPARRIIHIPIERSDDTLGSTRVMNTSKVETIKNTVVQNNNFINPRQNGYNSVTSPTNGSNETILPIRLTDGVNESLEREEERLFQALRTGSVIPSVTSMAYEPVHSSVRERSSSPSANHSSRIAFAKERIRQSQEHPLTQQRLELQKRLPSPSSSLAAAIALQQGRTKFQPPAENFDDDHHHGHHHGHPHHGKDHGRQSWVSSMLRHSNGASVADRVQLFEKYPSHMVNTHFTTVATSSQTVLHSPPSLTPHASPTSPLPTISQIDSSPRSPTLLGSSLTPSVTYERINGVNSVSPALIKSDSSTPHSVSIVSVSMAPSMEPVGLSSPVIKTQSPTTTSSPIAPWRTIPIESYQPDASSGPKKQKQTLSLKPSSPPSLTSPIALRKENGITHALPAPKSAPVPKFYFPDGKLMPAAAIQTSVNSVRDALVKYPPFIDYTQLSQLLPEVGIPLYWKKPIWDYLGIKNDDFLEATRFITFYKALMSQCPDDEARFVSLMQSPESRKSLQSLSPLKGNSLSNEFCFSTFRKMYITMSDFIPMMQDIIDTHPGLGFLREAPEFHSRYVTTVISRIFYKVNRSWSGKLTWTELKRSNLMRIIKRLEEETDINTITEYFSYEHFYVIYCKFWELDKDHDLLINKEDLEAHGDYVLSRRIIERIFDGTVIRGWDVSSPVKCTSGKMTYSDFVWFLLSEEDKKTPTAIEYWFRCLDIDGDGILSLYELQYFYEEQQRRIESLHIEPVDFANVICCIMDMLHCSTAGIRLKDLKRNPQLATVIFNTLFNLDKYIEHEQRDPFSSTSTGNINANGEWQEGESDWDKYAAAEYESLIAEETPSDHLPDTPDYDDPGYFNLSLP